MRLIIHSIATYLVNTEKFMSQTTNDVNSSNDFIINNLQRHKSFDAFMSHSVIN